MKTTEKKLSLHHNTYTESVFIQYRFLLFFIFLTFVVVVNLVNIYNLDMLKTDPLALSKWVPWVCPFHFITDLLCPGCGLTRSFMAFIQGDFRLSFHFHPSGPLIHSFIIFLLFDFVFAKGKKLKQIYFYFVKATRFSTIILVLITVWTIYRNMV